MALHPELSKKNRYWLNKHRYYELKHFCLQYPLWKEIYKSLDGLDTPYSYMDYVPEKYQMSDPTANTAIKKVFYAERINLIKRTAEEADDYIHQYILKAVTENLSYTYLKNVLEIPCSRDMYYDRYRKFFWLLSKSRK